MAKVSRNAGKANRNIKHNEVGAGQKPRLSGNSSTTSVGKGGGKSGGRSDASDKALFKRGDSRGGKASNYLTDSTKAHRSKDAGPKASQGMTYPIQKPLARGE